jgi:ornithine cyclodeaminase
MTLRILNADDVRAALPMKDAIRAMRDAFTIMSGGEADVPLRTHIALAGPSAASALFMPAATKSPVRIGAKILTLFPKNPAGGRPFIHGLVLLFNARTGEPEGVLEGTTLTALRTGAASGLATKLLARRNARCVGVIGSGAQARTQLEAVCCVRKITEVRVYSRTRKNAVRFAREMAGREGTPDTIRVVRTATEAADGADIICTATPATRPVLGLGDISRGAHINAIGSYQPQMREIGPALVRRAKVVVDSRDAALAEAGELISCVKDGTIDAGFVELGEVVTGAQPGRENKDHISLFKSVGLAIQDLCAGEYALRRARRNDIGVEVPM